MHAKRDKKGLQNQVKFLDAFFLALAYRPKLNIVLSLERRAYFRMSRPSVFFYFWLDFWLQNWSKTNPKIKENSNLFFLMFFLIKIH